MPATETRRSERDIPEIKDAPALSDLQHDIQALKDDLSRLATQIAEVVTARGASAWDRAKTSLDETVEEASAKGKEMADATREVTDTAIDTIEEAIRERPLTTLALTLGIGFIIGAAWRR